MSGLSGLSLQVIYTPARLSGSNKAFYVQINSVVGAQPSSALGQMSWGQWGERWRRQGGRLCSYCHWGEERTQGGNTIYCCILITRPLTEDFFLAFYFLQIVFFNIKLQVMTYHSPKLVLFTSCSTLVLIKTVILRTIHWVWIKVWSNSFNQDSDEKRGLAARQVPTPRLVRGLGMLQQSAQTKLDTIIEQRPPIISITPYGAEDEERDTKSTLTCTELQRARPSPEADKLPAVRFSPNLQAAACTARRGAFFSPKKTEKKKAPPRVQCGSAETVHRETCSSNLHREPLCSVVDTDRAQPRREVRGCCAALLLSGAGELRLPAPCETCLCSQIFPVLPAALLGSARLGQYFPNNAVVPFEEK